MKNVPMDKAISNSYTYRIQTTSSCLWVLPYWEGPDQSLENFQESFPFQQALLFLEQSANSYLIRNYRRSLQKGHSITNIECRRYPKQSKTTGIIWGIPSPYLSQDMKSNTIIEIQCTSSLKLSGTEVRNASGTWNRWEFLLFLPNKYSFIL